MSFRTAVVAFALSLPFAAHADPTADLEVARSKAHQHFREADGRIQEVATALGKANEAFRGCKNGVLQNQFSATLNRLEASRRSLENGRKQAQALRKSLEAVRKQLESDHAHRNTITKQEGDATEQHYAERMLSEYVKPLDSELVPLIDTYTSGVMAYSQAMTQYAEFCTKPGFTASAGATFVSSLEATVEGLSTKSAQLVSAAVDARKAVEGRAVSAK